MLKFAKIMLTFLPLLALTGCFGLSCACGPGLTSNEFGASSSLAEEDASAAIAKLLKDDFGQALAPSDHKVVAVAQARALGMKGSGVAVSWQNSRTGHKGEVRPGPLYQVNETTCREVTHELILDGHRYTARGTACKGADNAWQNLS